MEKNSLSLLTVVVQRKLEETVLEAALKAGATGVTYYPGEGAGVRQALGFFGQFIDAEKTIFFVVVQSDRVDTLLDSIAAAGEFSKPGHGFAFVQDVVKAIGFFETAPSAAKAR